MASVSERLLRTISISVSRPFINMQPAAADRSAVTSPSAIWRRRHPDDFRPDVRNGSNGASSLVGRSAGSDGRACLRQRLSATKHERARLRWAEQQVRAITAAPCHHRSLSMSAKNVRNRGV